jgi:hypothetical protein
MAGFVLITLGLIMGPSGVYEWGPVVVDRKIILAFVTWGIYLARFSPAGRSGRPQGGLFRHCWLLLRRADLMVDSGDSSWH